MGFRISLCFIKFFPLFFLFTVLFFPQSAPADLLAMEHTLGFNGIFKLKEWTPLTVVIENRHKGIQGQLEVVVTSGSEYQNDVYHTNYSREVDLPTQSKKTYGFTILIDSYVHPLIIRLRKEKEIILSQSINLREHYTTKPLLIFVGENLKDLPPLDSEEYQPVYTPCSISPRDLVWLSWSQRPHSKNQRLEKSSTQTICGDQPMDKVRRVCDHGRRGTGNLPFPGKARASHLRPCCRDFNGSGRFPLCKTFAAANWCTGTLSCS